MLFDGSQSLWDSIKSVLNEVFKECLKKKDNIHVGLFDFEKLNYLIHKPIEIIV